MGPWRANKQEPVRLYVYQKYKVERRFLPSIDTYCMWIRPSHLQHENFCDLEVSVVYRWTPFDNYCWAGALLQYWYTLHVTSAQWLFSQLFSPANIETGCLFICNSWNGKQSRWFISVIIMYSTIYKTYTCPIHRPKAWDTIAGLIVGLHPASERLRYDVSHSMGVSLESVLQCIFLNQGMNLFVLWFSLVINNVFECFVCSYNMYIDRYKPSFRSRIWVWTCWH